MGPTKDMTEIEKAMAFAECARELWECNQSVSAQMAGTIYKKNELPPTATTLIPNLAKLLADVQKQSFLLGAVAMLHSIESSGRTGMVQ